VPDEVAASARGVRVRFGQRAALDGVDLDLLHGGLTALVGPNGAGKTTLLRVLAGLQSVDAGTVEILGGRDLRRRAGYIPQYIPQDIALDPEMTGREILVLMAALQGVRRRDRPGRVADLARTFGCAEHLPSPVSSWSGGLKRRLHLAAGMIQDPDLLLLDEPTAGLDLEGADFLWAELERRTAAGRAVAVVTHDLAAVERHARQVAVLDRGRVVALGPPSEVGGGDLAAAFRRLTGAEPQPPRQPQGRRGRGER
jgi:ABC-2 type transport system ATP-binding protein